MSTVHQFPVQRNQPPAAPEEVADALGVAIDAAVGADASFEAREAAALALTNEATRLFLERELLAIADGHGTHMEVDGVIYQRHEPGIVRYFTLCGAVDIERWTDREMGVRNGPTLVPLDLDAGLVERTTPALGFRIALGYAKDHMRSCAEDMTADHRCPPSRSTLERVAKAIGTAATRVAPRIEPRLRRAERVPDGAVAISLGLDRTSVPMEEDVPAGETPATRRKTRHTPYTRTKPAPVNVNDRMAYVGRRNGAGHAPLHRCSARVPYGPSRATDDGRSSPCAPAGARPGRRGHPGRRARAVESPAPGPPGRTAGHGLLRSDRPVSSHRAARRRPTVRGARRVHSQGAVVSVEREPRRH